MAIKTTYIRAKKTLRVFAYSLCALVAGTSVAFGQSASFRDASLMSELAEASASTSSQNVARDDSARINRSAIRQVGSVQPVAKPVVPVVKPRAIRQTQFSQSTTAQNFGDASAQSLSEFEFDQPYQDACPNPLDVPPVADIPYKLVPSPGKFPESCPLPDEDFQRKCPTPITFTWKASNLCYKPLYFEDVQLERYGHYCHPLLQPALSRVRFWLTIPCLPYLIGVDPPNQCVYDLGYYRPGNCAPSMIEPIPISLRGAVLEAGAVVGLCAALP